MFKRSWSAAAARVAGDPLADLFGSLERQVMDVVWSGGSFVVRDVQERLARPAAYTTVMTTLDRLYKKGYVTRVRQGRAFSYSAARSREDVQATLAAGALTGALSSNASGAMPILSNLVEAVGNDAHGADLLEQLEALVRERRRQLQERDR